MAASLPRVLTAEKIKGAALVVRAQNISAEDAENMLEALAADKRLSLDEISDEILGLLAAGHETTSNTVTFALYCLAHRPQYQEPLREEVRRWLQRHGGKWDHKSLLELTLTWQVFREALRLFPTAPLNIRSNVEATSLMGYAVPKESIMVINNYAVARDPEVFPNPDEFVPERWDPSQRSQAFDILRNFGGGLRQCPGKRFAEEEGIVLIASIVAELKVHPTAALPAGQSLGSLDTTFAFTLSPTEKLSLRFEPW
jgi:cytochrome P450